MIFLNLNRYPIGGGTINWVDSGAALKVEQLTQSEPYTNRLLLNFTPSSSNVPAYFGSLMARYDTNATFVDLLRLNYVIEGRNKQALLDRVMVKKRSDVAPHWLYWDYPAVAWKFITDQPVEMPFTATDYDGAPVSYSAVNLPTNATYDGVFRWTPVVGTYQPTFIATSPYFAITSTVHITVTNLYTVHLAYDAETGMDTMPVASAEDTNFTGAAATWIVATYMNGPLYTNRQQEIYDATIHDAGHNGEITPESCADYLNVVGAPIYNFTERVRTNMVDALRDIAYWMDYQPAGGEKTPVSILTGTNWTYKVVRGFQSDVKPYDGGAGPGTNFTLYGFWIDEPRVIGFGRNIFVPAAAMSEAYAPSDASGNYRFVTDPPGGSERAGAEARLAGMHAGVAPLARSDELRYLLSNGSPGLQARGGGGGGPHVPTAQQIRSILPAALFGDLGFQRQFDRGTELVVHEVDAGERGSYVLLAGGMRGPGSTVYVMQLDPDQGAMLQATWSEVPQIYPPVPEDAAVWLARRTSGVPAEAEVERAELVYDPSRCVSPFLPLWRVTFSDGKDTFVRDVGQDADLSHDSDGDGQSDRVELYAGSDPDDAGSTFAIAASRAEASSVPGDVVLRWASAEGRTYSVYRSYDLRQGFSRIAGHVSASPPQNILYDQGAGGVVFYYVEAE
jgi:hypothetical protein